MPICTGRDGDGVVHLCIEEMFNPVAELGLHLTIPCITDSDGTRWPIALPFCDCVPTREECKKAMKLLEHVMGLSPQKKPRPEDLILPLVKRLEEENALNGGYNILSRVYLYLADPVQYAHNRERWGSTVGVSDHEN